MVSRRAGTDVVGFGVFDTPIPLLLAESLRETGRYNVSRGVLGTIQGWEGPSAMWSPLRLLSRQGTASPGARGIRIHRFLLVLIAMPETKVSAHGSALTRS